MLNAKSAKRLMNAKGDQSSPALGCFSLRGRKGLEDLASPLEASGMTPRPGFSATMEAGPMDSGSSPEGQTTNKGFIIKGFG
jgi:hypothetical protein